MPRSAAEVVVAALELKVGIADARSEEADKGVAGAAAGPGLAPDFDAAFLQVDGDHG
jgi:hypothetical protein